MIEEMALEQLLCFPCDLLEQLGVCSTFRDEIERGEEDYVKPSIEHYMHSTAHTHTHTAESRLAMAPVVRVDASRSKSLAKEERVPQQQTKTTKVQPEKKDTSFSTAVA
eukprot:gene12437-8527_t